MHPEDTDASPYKERPNKTQLRKEALALTEFAKMLSELTKAELASLELPDNIAAALNDYIRTTSHIAKKRQGQYLGKVMRKLEPEMLDSIREKAAAISEKRSSQTQQFHLTEQWRTKLLTDSGNNALTEFISQFPETDRQSLRHLIQKARKEQQQAKSLGAAKALFRYLRNIIETAQ